MVGERQPFENPESFRAGVLETIQDYNIRLVVPSDREIPQPNYGPDYIEFKYDSHLYGRLDARVRDNQVYVNGINIEGMDNTNESMLIRFCAIAYDPRIVLSKLTDIRVSHGVETSQTRLRGNFDPFENKILFVEDFENQIHKRSKDNLLDILIGWQDYAGLQDQLTREDPASLEKLKSEWDDISEDEARKKILGEVKKPWEFDVVIDSRNLPVSINGRSGMFYSLALRENWETINYEYTPKSA